MIIDPFEKDKLLGAVETLRVFIENIDEKKSCSSCMFFTESGAKCSKFNQPIPDHIIHNGCESWEFDMIPF